MTVAQQLYEGVDLGGETVGLITYMRTDSTRISAEAAGEAKDLILNTHGKDYALDKPRFFANKNRAQDAHEAIRPTSVFNTPDKVKPFLSKDQLALYQLIWQRFVASQMAEALIDQKSIAIAAGNYQFTVSGSTVKFPGFLALYQSADDTDEAENSKQKGQLPEIAEKENLNLLKLMPKQHFTAPPPRFSEATLVKELEENGIGRPSTYAAILTTIRDKGYVELIKGNFHPTELGFIITDLLVENFPDILNVDFTARLEDDLDKVEADEQEAMSLLTRFYELLEQRLSAASDNMLSVKGLGLPTGFTCPECGRQARIKVGKNGPFLACEGYPECTWSRNYVRTEKGAIEPVEPSGEASSGEVCEKCGRPMVVKQGRYGEFLACSGYPECKHTRSLSSGGPPASSTGVPCPQEGCDGEIMERRSRRGKIFYGCSRYPDCTFALWDKPVARQCPECGASYLVEKETKKDGLVIKCVQKGCGYKENE
jgi:DNA topoisomerase-1